MCSFSHRCFNIQLVLLMKLPTGNFQNERWFSLNYTYKCGCGEYLYSASQSRFSPAPYAGGWSTQTLVMASFVLWILDWFGQWRPLAAYQRGVELGYLFHWLSPCQVTVSPYWTLHLLTGGPCSATFSGFSICFLWLREWNKSDCFVLRRKLLSFLLVSLFSVTSLQVTPLWNSL